MDRGLVSGTLYVVATPLGHLGDVSARAAEVLTSVPIVAAEDTRHSRKLLTHLGAHPELLSIHQHTAPERIDEVVDRLVAGADVAVVTDAGTPVVSDPGARLVAAARDAGIRVIPIPGPSAVATALSASGFPADQYLFLGFLERKGSVRAWQLETVRSSPWTVVLFEAANRLVATLRDLGGERGGDRSAVVCREMTKVHEEFRAGTLDTLAAYYDEHPPKGEVTLVVAGATVTEEGSGGQELRAREVAARLLRDGLSKRDVVKALQETMQLSRNDAYQLVNALDA
ncbi:MAG: 16S rRNA (cytidine(1402)-2'-O)-methyltransferase [Gemmatimonadales bacterium]